MELIEQKPVVPPLQRHLQLETDLFCHVCGYNLHGQVVTRDERLDFLVCRCPECGQFHPAAMGVSATRPWLARAGVGVIVVWVLFALTVFGLAGFFMGMFNYIHMEIYTETIDPTGNRNWNDHVRIVRQPAVDDPFGYYQYQQGVWKVTGTISGLIAVGFGIFCSVAMWHVQKNRLLIVLIWPILAALATYGLWRANENIERIVQWSVLRTAAYAGLNLACMTAGLLVGRPVVRTILRVLVPPRLRQHVHFLWRCDGLQPPGVVSGIPNA